MSKSKSRKQKKRFFIVYYVGTSKTHNVTGSLTITGSKYPNRDWTQKFCIKSNDLVSATITNIMETSRRDCEEFLR